MGDTAGEGASLNNLGVIYFELADYPAALEHYLASLQIWQRLEHRDGAGHAFNNLGEVHEKLGDLDRALECYDQAMALLPAADRKAQRPGLVMAAIYRQLLMEIQRDGFQVLHQRTSLTPLRKLWLAWSTWVRA